MRTPVVIFCLSTLLYCGHYDYELYGTVEKVPAGRTGLWAISGKQVLTDSKTVFIERYGRIEEGALVEVGGEEENGILHAEEIISRTTRHDERREFGHKVKFVGIVNTLPETKEGAWSISGRNVEVQTGTRVDTPIKKGDRVRVKGYIQGDRVMAAEIKAI